MGIHDRHAGGPDSRQTARDGTCRDADIADHEVAGSTVIGQAGLMSWGPCGHGWSATGCQVPSRRLAHFPVADGLPVITRLRFGMLKISATTALADNRESSP